jgi:nitrogen-specific signal transduction histidine kinase
MTGSSKAMNRYIEIDIEDGGAGVPEELRETIFRGKFTTKERKSAGNGLKSAQRIMSMHRGWVLLCPQEAGRGATFRLLFPITRGRVGKL